MSSAPKKDKKKKKKAPVLSVALAAITSGNVSKKTNSSIKKKLQKCESKDNKDTKSPGPYKSTINDDDKHIIDLESSVGGSSDEDYSDDDDEGTDGYKAGGYHAVNLGDRFNQRYTVVSKLGWGHFSTVWMVHDRKCSQLSTPEYVALKIQKSAVQYTEAAMDEIELLRCVTTAYIKAKELNGGVDFDPCIVTLLDHFNHNGPNGKHVCMTFEMLGENLLKVIKMYNYSGIPINIVRNMTRQICIGLDFLHRHCSIIHTDLKPENILIAKPPPPPDIDIVRSLLNADSSNSNSNKSSKLSKKKKKKRKTVAVVPCVPDGISIEKQLQSKNISSEQRKKLKKKLKKKRQADKKKDTVEVDNFSERLEMHSSDDKVMINEMKMMKLESMPTSANADDDENNNNNFTAGDKYDTDANVSVDSNPQNDLIFASPADNQDTNDQDYINLHFNSQDRDYQWLRPTMFSYLNFSPDPECQSPGASGDSESAESLYTYALPLASALYQPPSEVMYAKISIVVSARKIYDAFGIPFEHIHDDDRDNNHSSLSQWFFALSTAESSDSNLTLSDESLHFTIIGHGDDASDIISLACSCIMNDVTCYPDKYLIALSTTGLDTPLIWDVQHDASMTQNLAAFLERKISGLKFVCHYDMAISVDEDIDMFTVAKKRCIHPMSNSDISDEQVGSDQNDDTDDLVMRMTGNGALLGLDIDAVVSSVALTELSECTTLPSYMRDLSSYALPLEKRLQYFTGESLQEIINISRNLEILQIRNNQLFDCYSSCNNSCDSIDDMNDGNGKQRSCNNLDADYIDAKVKIVDLGNACWTHKHFTDDIQTRQYRSPEVILGATYCTSADMWSLACIVFELLTGDLLFDPTHGKSWDREEDHLAMMLELVGHFPKSVKTTGKRASFFFNRKGELRNIRQLKYWVLEDILIDKYKFGKDEAYDVSKFLDLLLQPDPSMRATAQECLRHPWLKQADSASADGKESTVDYEEK